jgi:manganese/zinc/iron transport system permease protein
MSTSFLTLDLPALAAATLSAACCALLGSFLLLRRMSMLGDAISHAVLPGIVGAFLLFHTRSPGWMLLGAGVAGVFTAIMIELVKRASRVEAGAATGVVFSAMFALGVLLIQLYGRNVDLDADCVLYGSLEAITWHAAGAPGALGDVHTWLDLPRQIITLAGVTLVCATLVIVFFKQLRLYCFDSALCAAMGFPVWIMGGALAGLTAAATVASFESVGSILVIAMLVCPPAAARQLTDRLRTQVLLSVAIGVGCAITGYTLAAFGPGWLGHDRSVSASGMIAVVGGIVLVASALVRAIHVRRARNEIIAAGE